MPQDKFEKKVSELRSVAEKPWSEDTKKAIIAVFINGDNETMVGCARFFNNIFMKFLPEYDISGFTKGDLREWCKASHANYEKLEKWAKKHNEAAEYVASRYRYGMSDEERNKLKQEGKEKLHEAILASLPDIVKVYCEARKQGVSHDILVR